jgi:subtilisin family serine protease
MTSKMRLSAKLAALTCLIAPILCLAETGAVIHPDLAAALVQTADDALIPVSLVLKQQLDFSALYPGVLSLSKSERRSRVISELRALAQSSQVSLLRDLRSLEKLGRANQFRPLWISNVVAAQVRAGDLPPLLARHSEIARANWDPPRPFYQVADVTNPTRSYPELDQISWGVQSIQAPQVWSLGIYGQGALIGNMDTGADYTHPDLADHIWVNPGEDVNGNGVIDTLDWNGIDNDGNGYIDDLRGWAFDTQSPEVMDGDPEGHGTATSGIVCGDGTGGNQTGVAPQATLMILKIFGASESGYWEAMQYGIMMEADVVTSSISYKWYYNPKPDYATMRQNADAELAAGVIRTNSIGNQGDQQDICPIPFNIATPGNCPPPWLHPDQTLIGGLSSTLGNGAFSSNYQILYYSGVGPAAWSLRDVLALDPLYPWQAAWPSTYNDYPYENGQYQALLKPDLAAPTNVLTTFPGGGYVTGFSGTSAATPHTGGTVCLMLAANPDATPEILAQVLMTTAIDMDPPGKDNNWGAGRLDAYGAVTLLLMEISGTVAGVISDSNSSEPIYQASVDIPDLQLWTQTNTSGHYLLPGVPPGLYDVRFAADGYDTLIIPQVLFKVAIVETLDVALAGPQIEVDPDSIFVSATQGDSLQIPLTVENTGSSDLTVTFQKEGDWIPFGIFSVIQAQAATQDGKLFGVEVVQNSIWVTGGNNDLEPNYLYRFSFGGELLDTLTQPASTSTWGWYDLAYDGEYLYGSSGSVIQGVDLEGALQDSISGPLNLHRALAYDPASDHFYVADNTADIVEIDRDGEPLDSWAHDLHVQGLAWHAQDLDGYPLYIFSQDGTGALLQVSKMNPATGEILIAAELTGSPLDQAGGAAISGDLAPSRWCFIGLVQGALDRIQIHSMNAYAPWLSIEPATEVIPPGGTLNATVLFDAGVLSAGSYEIDVLVLNNSALPEIDIPTELLVQPLAVGGNGGVALPISFAVGPSYPNPFNATTIIPFDIPQTSVVEVELFNTVGQSLGQIHTGVHLRGRATVPFDAANISSGIYFYRLKAAGVEGGAEFTHVGKLVVLK